MKVNAGSQPVRMLVLLAACTSGAEHPSTIGAPSRWVTVLVGPSLGRHTPAIPGTPSGASPMIGLGNVLSRPR